MIDSIKRYVQEQNMFAEGDYVVAGVCPVERTQSAFFACSWNCALRFL